jgi:hypothetical protein
LDNLFGSIKHSNPHASQKYKDDVDVLLKALLPRDLFTLQPGRQLGSFPNFVRDMPLRDPRSLRQQVHSIGAEMDLWQERKKEEKFCSLLMFYEGK